MDMLKAVLLLFCLIMDIPEDVLNAFFGWYGRWLVLRHVGPDEDLYKKPPNSRLRCCQSWEKSCQHHHRHCHAHDHHRHLCHQCLIGKNIHVLQPFSSSNFHSTQPKHSLQPAFVPAMFDWKKHTCASTFFFKQFPLRSTQALQPAHKQATIQSKRRSPRRKRKPEENTTTQKVLETTRSLVFLFFTPCNHDYRMSCKCHMRFMSDVFLRQVLWSSLPKKMSR